MKKISLTFSVLLLATAIVFSYGNNFIDSQNDPLYFNDDSLKQTQTNIHYTKKNVSELGKISEELSDTELAFLPTHLLADKIRSGEVSSTKITEIYLARIAKYNPKINAIATLDAEGARFRAKEADEALAKGVIWGPLHGIPITIKDNYNVKGMRSTAGYEPLSNNIPNEDAIIVKRLRKAGAIILGKTNMPAMGMDSQTYNSIFGTTNNPWDLTRTPGGSSGGCSAAVAAGLISCSIGNDIGGSIRIPAHFTGVFGIKTTEGFVPETGMVTEKKATRSLRHLATHGPITRSVKDLSLILSVIAGSDGIDYQSPRVIVTSPIPPKPLSELRIAWSVELSGMYVTPEIKSTLSNFVKKLEIKGIKTEQALPKNFDFNKALSAYSDLFAAEVMISSSWLERSLLCMGGFPCPTNNLETYFERLAVRDSLAQNIEKFLTEYDVWLLPVTSGTAFKHRKADSFEGALPVYNTPLKTDGEIYRIHEFTSPFNLSGHPSVIIPIGFSEEGLPIGIQIIGRRWYDAELLEIAEYLSKIAGAYKRPNNFN